MKLIDKTALVTEIKRRIKVNKECMLGLKNLDYYQGKVDALSDTISFLATLEVKEVDLDKELDTWRHNHFHGRRDKDASGEYLERSSQLDIAKHFFELGMAVSNEVQKGE